LVVTNRSITVTINAVETAKIPVQKVLFRSSFNRLRVPYCRLKRQLQSMYARLSPEWRPGFPLDWKEGGDDGCGTPTTTTTLENNTAREPPKTSSTTLPLTRNHAEASDEEEDPEG
jgi:hypothetical protein